MIPTAELARTIRNAGAGVAKGRVMHLLAQQTKAGDSARQRQFLLDMLEMNHPTPATYDHPERHATRTGLGDRGPGPLTPTEIAWLQQLPNDPAKIDHHDAATLAALSHAISTMQQPMDANLVAAHWWPVKAVHDARAAQVAIANANQPQPLIPSSALAALADAFAAEHPDLTPTEAMGRAQDTLNTALARRRAHAQQQLAAARDALTAATTGAPRHDPLNTAHGGPSPPRRRAPEACCGCRRVRVPGISAFSTGGRRCPSHAPRGARPG